MAPKKSKKGTPAPTSKVPVNSYAAKEAAREEARQKRISERAQRSEENRAAHRANTISAKQLEAEVSYTMRSAGKQAAKNALPRGAASLVQKIGRPWVVPQVEWTEKLGLALLHLISTGHSMAEIAAMDGMPPLYQMLTWLADSTHPFSAVRTRGKEMLVPLYEELAASIAMNPGEAVTKVRKQVVTRDGDIVWVSERRTGDNTERAKLALQGIQWTLSHLKPKKHGRTPEDGGGGPNEQLKGLIDALKAGPVD